MSIEDRARALIVKHLEVSPEKVTLEARFFDELGADSLDHIELIMAFEEEFGLEITDDAAEKIQTVGDVISMLQRRLAAVSS